jgi:hypothetical protein
MSEPELSRPEPAAGLVSVRASDSEREATVERLRIASVEGRLTFTELTERTEAAYTAVTRDELDRLTADLPDFRSQPAAVLQPLGHEHFTAVLGDVKERLVGRIDRELVAVSVLGDVVLDLRQAHVPSGVVLITATAVLGDVKIIVPDGVVVRLSGFAVLGDRKIKVREIPPGRTAPVVQVRAHAVLGDVKVVDDEHHAPTRRAIKDWWNGRGAADRTP